MNASEATQVIIFPRAAPAEISAVADDFVRPLGAAHPGAPFSVELADIRAAIVVLRAAQRGHVTPGDAIAAALVRLDDDA